MGDEEAPRPVEEGECRVGHDVAAYALKIPPFWPTDPEIWFIQVEEEFRVKGITMQWTKYGHVVSNIPSAVATEVRDLLKDPPRDNPYDALKELLIRRTTASEQRRLQQLFITEELGDRKPTQLLRCMQQLLGEKAGAMDPSFIRELFL